MSDITIHQTNVSDRLAAEALIIDIDGYEGPLDLLLSLARTQKVDLRHISILALARQYLAFIETAETLRIELAAWLAFLKSRLLLPADASDDEPSGEELAAHLAFQLARLQAMRDVSAKLMARDQLGRDRFARGVSAKIADQRSVTYTASLLDVLQAYARLRTRDDFRPYVMDRENVFTTEQALELLREMIGFDGTWRELESYLPKGWRTDPGRRKSATAATFAASLELAKEGKLELQQHETFAPIKLRGRDSK